MLHHAVRDQIARVYHVFIARLEGDLVDLTASGQGEEAAAGDQGVAPVCYALRESAQELKYAVPTSLLTILVFTRGVRLRLCPVHAKRAFRCAIIQSSLPSRCTTTSELMGDFVPMRALYGVVEEVRWYMKGMPKRARRKGSRRESVDTACLAC